MLTVGVFEVNIQFAMKKNILLTGFDTHLGNEIGKFLIKQGHKLLATIEGTPQEEETDSPLKTVVWRPASPLSAKNLLLQSRGHFTQLDEVILLFSPIKEGIRFQNMTNQDISGALNTHFLSSLYLCREALMHLDRQNSGHLTIIIYEENSDTSGKALDQGIYQGFREFASALIKEYSDGRVTVFDSRAGEIESFLDYYYNLLSQKESKYPLGKYNRHSDRKNLLGAFSLNRN